MSRNIRKENMTEAVNGAVASRIGRSILSVFAGLLAVFVLSLGTDQIMHSLGIYPPLGQPMEDTGLLLCAFAYRCVYGVVGGYVAGRLASYAPVGHALVLGGIGVALSTMGAVAMWDYGPHWYPVALILTAVPLSWAGGMLARRGKA